MPNSKPNSTPNLVFEIVGASYRKPAITILKNIPLNTPLILYPEPWNTFDPNAISVWIHLNDIPFEKLPEGTIIEYSKNSEFQLGYIPKADAKNLSFDRTKTIIGIFKLSDTNKPQVKLTGFKKD